MITRKQYPNHHVFETSIGGRPFTVETGKVAELADAECICRYGDTVVLTTVTCSPDPKPGIDYFPLTIEFDDAIIFKVALMVKKYLASRDNRMI